MTSILQLGLDLLRFPDRAARRRYRAFRLARLGSDPQWRHVPGRFQMLIDPADEMDRAFLFGDYEQPLLRLIHSRVRPGDVCLDIGAQKGFISLHLAQAAGPAGRVLSFEPDPRARQALDGHLRRNRFSHVSVFPCALGDEENTCDFSLTSQLGWSSRFPNQTARSAVTSSIQVPVRRLDDIIAELGLAPERHRLSFIKMDAEGSEPLILAGARRTLRRFRPTLHIEINQASLRAGGFSPDSVETPLRELGYRFHTIACERPGWRLPRLALHPVASLNSGLAPIQDIVALPEPPSA